METKKAVFDNIFSCLVLFNPDEEHHISAIDNILTAGGKVVVFDNSDDLATAQHNRNLLSERFGANVEYLRRDGNIGLSAAFNRIVEHVLTKSDVEALVLFDQDSTVTAEMFTRLVEGYRRAALNHNVGVYAAYAVRVNGEPYGVRPVWLYSAKPPLLPVKFAPSSFSLIPISTFKNIGLFQEDFFIDQIDGDFCLRCWKSNLSVLIDTSLRFPHRIGIGDITIFKRKSIPVASPFRGYYQTRNIILSAKRNNVPVIDTLKRITIKISLITILGLKSGLFRKRLIFCLRGLYDGLLGRGGKIT